MGNLKASIIVPVYNVEKHLQKCLDSLLVQDYDNYEIILINDGSTDNSYEIAKEYTSNNAKITLLNQSNQGLSGARNTGIQHATGDVIFFVDSDDYVEPTFCSAPMQIFNSKSIDVVIFGFSEIFTKGKRQIINKHYKELDKITVLNELLVDKSIKNYAWNKACKRELFLGLEYPIGRAFEDVGFTYKIFDRASSFFYIPKPLYNYIIHDNTISHNWWKSEKKLNDYLDLRYEQYNYLTAHYPVNMKYANASLTSAMLIFLAYSSDVEKKKKVRHLLDSNYKTYKKTIFPFNIVLKLYKWKPTFTLSLFRKYM